ncbi:response regulator transcription factor [Christiangramia crocea]|uniref:Response regulator transcription factor n=1 Tax=Christiangramia crocea TaxID=2904124 RepID=A0A9X1UYT5_9FLAO|nr:response regulator transcription factor [Gramella crocea]MCG9972907.1 response regulator transcription factor [Gramella crocea]
MDNIRIVLADDHVLVRDGIKSLLEEQPDMEVVAEASDGKEAIGILEKDLPDLLIVDIRMPEMNGIEVVKKIRDNKWDVKTLVLSMHDSEEYVVQSVQAGADGYLLKGSSKDEFLKALHKVASGGKYFSGDISAILINNFTDGKPVEKEKKQEDPFNLTKREKQILKLVLQGKSNKEIGNELEISKRTAEVHRFNLMKKLDVKNLIELTNKAREYQLA